MSSAARIAARSCGVGRAEHDAQDHVERQLLHPRQRPQRPAGLPAGELGLGERGDRRAVRLHPLAVERRQHQLALAQVLLARS